MIPCDKRGNWVTELLGNWGEIISYSNNSVLSHDVVLQAWGRWSWRSLNSVCRGWMRFQDYGDGREWPSATKFYNRCCGCPTTSRQACCLSAHQLTFPAAAPVSFCLKALACQWCLPCHPTAGLQCQRINTSQRQPSTNDWWIPHTRSPHSTIPGKDNSAITLPTLAPRVPQQDQAPAWLHHLPCLPTSASQGATSHVNRLHSILVLGSLLGRPKLKLASGTAVWEAL